jgi:UTP:GlnB (protein PII) uridylyltransferase
MPAAYSRAFTIRETQEHARIVERRGTRLVHAEICLGSASPVVCLAADDRPGLLALVTDALLVHGLSIHTAQVYCRRRTDGQTEAVDFFQLEHPQGESGIDDTELGAFLQTLSELVAEDVLAASRPSAAPPSRQPATRVYFDLDKLRGGESTLLVEAPDSEGLLNAISSALHGQNVRITASEIRTLAGVAHDRFDLVSSDGELLSAVRLCDIQQAVLAALPKAVVRR